VTLFNKSEEHGITNDLDSIDFVLDLGRLEKSKVSGSTMDVRKYTNKELVCFPVMRSVVILTG